MSRLVCQKHQYNMPLHHYSPARKKSGKPHPGYNPDLIEKQTYIHLYSSLHRIRSEEHTSELQSH